MKNNAKFKKHAGFGLTRVFRAKFVRKSLASWCALFFGAATYGFPTTETSDGINLFGMFDDNFASSAKNSVRPKADFVDDFGSLFVDAKEGDIFARERVKSPANGDSGSPANGRTLHRTAGGDSRGVGVTHKEGTTAEAPRFGDVYVNEALPTPEAIDTPQPTAESAPTGIATDNVSNFGTDGKVDQQEPAAVVVIGEAQGAAVSGAATIGAFDNIAVPAKNADCPGAELVADRGLIFVEAKDGDILPPDSGVKSRTNRDLISPASGNAFLGIADGDIGDVGGNARVGRGQGMVNIESGNGTGGENVQVGAPVFPVDTTGGVPSIYGNLAFDEQVANKTPADVDVTHKDGKLPNADDARFVDLPLGEIRAEAGNAPHYSKNFSNIGINNIGINSGIQDADHARNAPTSSGDGGVLIFVDAKKGQLYISTSGAIQTRTDGDTMTIRAPKNVYFSGDFETRGGARSVPTAREVHENSSSIYPGLAEPRY